MFELLAKNVYALQYKNYWTKYTGTYGKSNYKLNIYGKDTSNLLVITIYFFLTLTNLNTL